MIISIFRLQSYENMLNGTSFCSSFFIFPFKLFDSGGLFEKKILFLGVAAGSDFNSPG